MGYTALETLFQKSDEKSLLPLNSEMMLKLYFSFQNQTFYRYVNEKRNWENDIIEFSLKF